MDNQLNERDKVEAHCTSIHSRFIFSVWFDSDKVSPLRIEKHSLSIRLIKNN